MRAPRLIAILLATATLAAARPAAAWETSTHVGLAEQAGLAADLDGVLRQLGWRGGLFEPLVIPPEDAPTLLAALALHSASDGFVPDIRGQQYALGWLLAGAALADATPGWAANHFLDPISGAGWHGQGGALAAKLAGRAATPGRGVPAVEWITAADNPLGLAGFLDQYGKAQTAATPGERARAMAGALVAAGALLHVLADMAAPSHVRGAGADQDEVVDIATGERGARLDRLTAIAFGRLGVPAPRAVINAPTLRGFFVDTAGPDGAVATPGLASWTASHFFSPATLPRPVPAGRLPRERLAQALTAALRRPAPVVPARLSLLTAGQPEGATLRDDHKVCLARYRVERGLLSWSLDDDCQIEQAQAILPVAAGYEAGLLRWLFRGELELRAGDGGVIAASTRGLALGAGSLTLLAEDGRGVRTVVSTTTVTAAADGAALASATLPAGSRRAVAVFRGVDGAGEQVVAVGLLDQVRVGP